MTQYIHKKHPESPEIPIHITLDSDQKWDADEWELQLALYTGYFRSYPWDKSFEFDHIEFWGSPYQNYTLPVKRFTTWRRDQKAHISLSYFLKDETILQGTPLFGFLPFTWNATHVELWNLKDKTPDTWEVVHSSSIISPNVSVSED